MSQYAEVEDYLLRTMDFTKDPCGDSFYDYACGNFGKGFGGYENAHSYVLDLNLKLIAEELGGPERSDDVSSIIIEG